MAISSYVISTVIKKMVREIDIEELEKHSTEKDCWMVVDNIVYDVSNFASSHPGGTLYLSAAATDATVLFYQYHALKLAKGSNENISALLKKKIGNYIGPKSPVMGLFYKELSSRVSACLSGLPTVPLSAILMMYIDVCGLVLSTIVGTWMGLTNNSNIFLLLIIPFLANVFIYRVCGHGHANGHMQYRNLAQWNELLLTLVGTFSILAYLLPKTTSTFRKQINRPRAISQYEYKTARGPFEHQAIHHVKGPSMKEDQCYKNASRFGLLRLSNRFPHLACHRLQKWPIYITLTSIINHTWKGIFQGFAMLSISSTLFEHGHWAHGACALFGFLFSSMTTYTSFILPMSKGSMILLP